MTENRQRSLDQVIYHGYPFHLRQYLNEGWQIFRQNMGSFIGYSWLIVLIGLAAGIIPIIGTIANALLLSPALISGLFIVAHLVQRNQYNRFEQFFGGFSFYSPLLIQQLLLFAFYLVAALPAIYWIFSSGLVEFYRDLLLNPLEVSDLDTTDLNWRQSWLPLLSVVLYIYMSIIYLWPYLFIVLDKANAWEALEYSRKIIGKKWFSFFGMMIVFILITFGVCLPLPVIVAVIADSGNNSLTMTGVLLALILSLLVIIGALSVLFPWFYCTIYAAFADITQLNEEKEEANDLVNHLVE